MSEHTTPQAGNPPQVANPSRPTGALAQRYGDAMIPVFGTPQRVLVRGQGVHVWDDQDKQYLDLLGGIAVNALGHGHPALVSAITKQLETLGHISNFFASGPQIELAEKLLQLAGAPAGSGVFFANSGSEANEAAFKMARRTGKGRILALEGGFHGRTMGSLALTHKVSHRTPFAPLPGGVEWIPPDDIGAAEAALADGDVAAVFAEVIQGEAGVRPLQPEYLRVLRELTRTHGALLVLDEVQTGVGRTGQWFAHQQIPDLIPDVMTLAKGLGGGFPIGATIAYGPQVRALLGPGQHGTTFGGNPPAAAAALAVLGTITEQDLLAHARRTGQALADQVRDLGDARTGGVRGAGLLRGIALTEPIAAQVVQAGLEAGFIVNAPDPTTIRLGPALTITPDQLATFTAALPALLDRAADLAAGAEGGT